MLALLHFALGSLVAWQVEKIASRYPDTDPQQIVKKLLGSDVSIDDPLPTGRATASSGSIGVTGEQGGRLLACYLYKLEHDGDAGAE